MTVPHSLPRDAVDLGLGEGMIVIADEVGSGKISDLFTQMEPAIVESCSRGTR